MDIYIYIKLNKLVEAHQAYSHNLLAWLPSLPRPPRPFRSVEVYAPQWTAPSLRMEFQWCESSRARGNLGRVVTSEDRFRKSEGNRFETDDCPEDASVSQLFSKIPRLTCVMWLYGWVDGKTLKVRRDLSDRIRPLMTISLRCKTTSTYIDHSNIMYPSTSIIYPSLDESWSNKVNIDESRCQVIDFD